MHHFLKCCSLICLETQPGLFNGLKSSILYGMLLHSDVIDGGMVYITFAFHMPGGRNEEEEVVIKRWVVFSTSVVQVADVLETEIAWQYNFVPYELKAQVN